jgi:hypothetical protein
LVTFRHLRRRCAVVQVKTMPAASLVTFRHLRRRCAVVQVKTMPASSCSLLRAKLLGTPVVLFTSET